jgi:hypothetical protein
MRDQRNWTGNLPTFPGWETIFHGESFVEIRNFYMAFRLTSESFAKLE